MAMTTPQLVSPDPAAVVALFVAGGLLLILMGVAATLFVVYRKEFPINGRGVAEVLAMLVSGAFTTISLVTGRFFPCAVNAIPYALGCHCALLIWLVRIWRLLFRFQLHQSLYNVGLLRQQPDSPQKRASIEREVGSWYVRNRSLGNWPFIRKIVALLTLVELAAMSFVAYPSIFSAAPCPVAVSLPFWDATFGINLFYIVCGVAASVLIRGFSSDAYKIKSELVRVGGGAIVFLILFVPVKQFGPLHLLLPEFMLLLILYNLTFWSTVWPVLLVRERKRMALHGAECHTGPKGCHVCKDQTSEFVNFLNTQGGLEAFLGFLQKEFATENMLFLMDVQQFRRNIEDLETEDEENLNAVGPAVKKELVELFETYRDKINISAPARNSLLCLLARVDTMYLNEFRHAFDMAYGEIFKLLRQDSWQRYRRSADFDVFQNNQATAASPVLVAEALNARWELETVRSRVTIFDYDLSSDSNPTPRQSPLKSPLRLPAQSDVSHGTACGGACDHDHPITPLQVAESDAHGTACGGACDHDRH